MVVVGGMLGVELLALRWDLRQCDTTSIGSDVYFNGRRMTSQSIKCNMIYTSREGRHHVNYAHTCTSAAIRLPPMSRGRSVGAGGDLVE